MANRIEGRLSLSIFDSIAVMFVFFFFINWSLNDLPTWASILLFAGVIGFATSIYRTRSRGMVVKYDDEGARTYRKTLRGLDKEERVAWRKVYGIEQIPNKPRVGLVGKQGQVLLEVPTEWRGLEEFTRVVLEQLEKKDRVTEQRDFYLPRLKFGAFSPPVISLLSVITLTILYEMFFPSGSGSLWQDIRFEVYVMLLVAGVGLLLQSYRLTSLHVGKQTLTLKYPLITRRIAYQEIASAELVEDPNKPVTSEIRRLRVNLKGRAKHYHINEFPHQVKTIHQRINQRLDPDVTDEDAHSAFTEKQI